MSQAFQQSLPQMLAAFRENGAPNPTRQFQRGLLHNQRAVDLYIDFDCVSFVLFSRQSDCDLISFYLFVCWYSRGSSCFSATRPGVVGTILVRLFIGTVDQQPDLGAFGRKSVCSWPRLHANSGETGGQNNQWRLRWACGSPSGEHRRPRGQGIKRHQGSSLPQRQPVTADLMRIIQRSLDAHNSEHIMLWAACCLGQGS